MIARLLEVFSTLVIPAYAIVALGWGLARTPHIPLSWLALGRRLVFDVVLPVYLLRTLASVDLPEAPRADYVSTYYAATLLLYGAITAASWHRSGGGSANIHGLAAVYANAVLLGVPLVTAALGPEAAVPLFLLIAVHAPILAVATGVLAEIARPASGRGFGALMGEVLHGIATNPIILGILGGLAWNLLFGPLPAAWQARTTFVATWVPVLALLAMGIGLAGYRMRRALGVAATLTGAKLVLHPAVVATALLLLTDLPTLWWQTAVLMAAMPTGVNVYLFAARQGAAEAESAATVALATPASMLTLTIVLALLLH